MPRGKFVSHAQRAAVMAKLKSEGFRERPKRVDTTKNYYRARLRNPGEFQKGSLRVKDIGRPGHTKAVIGRSRGMRTTRMQSILIPKSDVRLR